MNLDEDLIWLFLIAVAVFLIAIAILIYAAALLLHVRERIKETRPLEVVQRDGDGRRRQERV
jgi:formate-dependent nitrite reductase membrane component NrfD